MLLEVARNNVEPSGAGLASRSSPAYSPRVKLENGSRRRVKGKMENMTKPAGAALCGQTACSGLARSGPKRFIGNPLGPPDVLDGSESPAIKTI
ncbi:hypothetical protein JOB18_036478 [Solea senegalensis]|uniref:Uncharacterized protein n=1 Tax=Solea senegalensis TaxID=28829 RepID=A0AAV6Q514_SOLSE|nr:hypothetical protein JOB18_036478 [Solea senegalensis]